MDDYNKFIDNLKQFVQADLAEVDNYISNNHNSSVQLVNTLVSHLISAGGKRLRPIICLLGSKIFTNSLQAPHYKMAASVEYIHNATLLHDDVVDFSLKRRSQPSANALYNNKVSILVGDFLFARAFEMMVGGESLSALQLLSRVSSILAEGEVLQLQYLGDMNMSIDTYITINNCKTGALFGAASSIGAILQNQDKTIQDNLYAYGEYLGIAFQLADDILDYARAYQKDSGKNAGDDFFEGKITLPLLLTYQQASTQEQEWIAASIAKAKRTKADYKKMLQLIATYDTLNQAQEYAFSYADKALACIEHMPAHPATDYLRQLVYFMIKRPY